MNNILKVLKSKEARNSIAASKHSSYNCNYDLVTGKYGNYDIVLSFRDHSCYNSFFYSKGNFDEADFSESSNQKFISYALSNDTRLTDKEINRYIKELKKLGIPFKVKVEQDYDLNVTAYSDRMANTYACYAKQKVYILVVNLKDVNEETLKILLYFWRYIYEYDHDLIVKKSLEYKDKFKRYSFFTILNLAQATHDYTYGDPLLSLKKWKKPNGDSYTYYGKSVHRIFKTFKKGITLKALKEYINDRKKTIADNDKVITNLIKGEYLGVSFTNYGYRETKFALSTCYPFNMEEDLNKQAKEYFSTTKEKFTELIKISRNSDVQNVEIYLNKD